MKTFTLLSFVGLALLLTLASWSQQKHVLSQEARLLAIAEEYEDYSIYPQINNGVLYDTAYLRWSQVLCRPNVTLDQSQNFENEHIKFSQAGAKSKHGDKLYKFFIKDHDAYLSPKLEAQPVGQTLVKETWEIEVYDPKTASGNINSWRPYKVSQNDGKAYTPTKPMHLFVMYKEAPSDSNDDGWVYGIVDISQPEKKATVLEKGKIKSCMSCHKNAKYDRIIGR